MFAIIPDFRGTRGGGETVKTIEIGYMCNSLRCIPSEMEAILSF